MHSHGNSNLAFHIDLNDECNGILDILLLPLLPSQVYVLKRPHVDEFLRRMGQMFECVLFTASLAKVCKSVYIYIYICKCVCTIFIRIEAVTFISYKWFLTQRLYETFLYFTQVFTVYLLYSNEPLCLLKPKCLYWPYFDSDHYSMYVPYCLELWPVSYKRLVSFRGRGKQHHSKNKCRVSN